MGRTVQSLSACTSVHFTFTYFSVFFYSLPRPTFLLPDLPTVGELVAARQLSPVSDR